jgi:RNA polymerase sigma-70 factor (ECF subfamily)
MMARKIVGVREDRDRDLVTRAQGGDREALGELFVRHSSAVRRLLASVIGPTDELDDLVQEVFIQVYRSLPGFRGDALFSTWLHQVTVYAAYNYLRRPRRRWVPTDPERMASISGQSGESPHARLYGRETLRRLHTILDSIKPKKRIAFILFAVNGHSVGEVAEMVGAPIPTVKSRIWFARRELKKKARRDPYLSQLLDEMNVDEND